MTSSEQQADNLLLDAKIGVKRAFAILDPSPGEPLAIAILKTLDAIDEARKELAQRGPK